METAIPPSYEEATTKDHWAVIAEYIASADLCATSLVSKKWHSIFAPYLWGNPARHFGTENDRVYVALTRFKRTLPTARSKVRQLTHTLQLPPALSEIYDGPKAEWLRDVLEHLPNLQSLIVSELPFFDHSALIALRTSGTIQTEAGFPTYPLRLLIGTKCANTTSAGLAEALLHWPSLVFLDLSATTPARDTNVLSTFRFMSGLRVLKLRGIGLRDGDVETLAESIGLKLRSLDIRDNRVTDDSVRSLLTHCFHPTSNIHAEQSQASRARLAEEDWPCGVPRLDVRVMDEFRGDDLDERFVKKLTRSVVGRMPSEDLPYVGITHLYIANNFITMEGLASLIRTENLHVLDAGAVDTAKALTRKRSSYTSSPLDFGLPGAEKLTPVLEDHAGSNLTSLRVHHALLTSPAALKDDLTPLAELGGMEMGETARRTELDAERAARYELNGHSNVQAELDSSPPVYEMPGDTPAPLYELPAEPLDTTAPSLSIGGQTPEPLEEPSPNRGAIFAPEVVVEEGIEGASSTPSGFAHRVAPSVDSTLGQSVEIQVSHNAGRATSLGTEVATEILRIAARRNELRHGIRDVSRALLPGLIPSLHSLILTGVPNTDDIQGTVVKGLRQFISDCALESHLASTQAKLEHPQLYVPGKPRSLHAQHRSSELFGLRKLVLEMAPQSIGVTRPRSSSEHSLASPSPLTPPPGFSKSAFNQRNRSSTGDPDTENFWNAQEDDFTFFGEEECGLPAREPGLSVPRSILSQKMALMNTNDEAADFGSSPGRGLSMLSVPPEQNEAGKSVIAELAKWRAERKKLAERIGKNDDFVEGYWKGEVKVVRPNVGTRTGFVDWYGNYFENSYNYR